MGTLECEKAGGSLGAVNVVSNESGEVGKILGFFKHTIPRVVPTSHTNSENQRTGTQNSFVQTQDPRD